MLQSASRGVVSAPGGMGGCLVWGWGVPGLGGVSATGGMVMSASGGSAPRGGGVCTWSRGMVVSAPGGRVCSRGGGGCGLWVSQHALRHTPVPPLWTDTRL